MADVEVAGPAAGGEGGDVAGEAEDCEGGEGEEGPVGGGELEAGGVVGPGVAQHFGLLLQVGAEHVRLGSGCFRRGLCGGGHFCGGHSFVG